MTTHEGFDSASPDVDRLLTAWFDVEARVRAPDDLLERTLARSSRARPLPAWLLFERWLPMELTMRRARLPRATPYVVLLIVLALLATVALAIVGAAPRVPAPFGLAANGSIAFVDQGRVTTLDPTTGNTRTVFDDGRRTARYPTFSRDGRRLAFVSSLVGGRNAGVFAVDATGQGLVRLTEEPLMHPGLLTWSPDGSTLAFEDDGRLWLARTDGSGARAIDVGVTLADELQWRPPDGRQLLFRGLRDGRAALYLADADGSDPTAITPVDGGDFDYLWTTWSPDGRRVAYHRLPPARLEILTIGERDPVRIRPVGNLGLAFPRFSPDGSRLGVMVWDGALGHPSQVGVIAADDPTPVVTLTGPANVGGIQHDWSPDGSDILAVWWGTSVPWIMDPNGGPGTRADWSMSIPDWVEWQRLAR